MIYCRPPQGGDFAPDEMHELHLIANRVATNRDDLLATSLREELRGLRDALKIQSAAVSRLT